MSEQTYENARNPAPAHSSPGPIAGSQVAKVTALLTEVLHSVNAPIEKRCCFCVFLI
jgi:hypothetical protein